MEKSLRTDKTERPSLADTFFVVAQAFAERSTCPDGARHGCVITVAGRVIATGYGSPPVGVPPCERCWLREQFAATGVKDWSVCPSIHAEANAVACAARNGVSTKHAIAWVTREPCERCYALLVSAGVATVCWPEDANPSKLGSPYYYKEIQIPVSGPHIVVKAHQKPCQLEVDSPSYPPSDDERRQCGCLQCLAELE